MTSQTFVIDGELVDLNKYVNACRAHWAKGKAMKAEQTATVMAYARKARLVPMEGPVEVGISWIEGRRRGGNLRDVDNIAFAAKFVLDALKELGVIPDDNPRVVRNVYHFYKFNAEHPRVEVTLMDYDRSGRTVHYMPISGLG